VRSAAESEAEPWLQTQFGAFLKSKMRLLAISHTKDDGYTRTV